MQRSSIRRSLTIAPRSAQAVPSCADGIAVCKGGKLDASAREELVHELERLLFSRAYPSLDLLVADDGLHDFE